MPSDPDAIRRLRADPHFLSLARSLWGGTELRGAAVMVGAGMSRNAVRLDPSSPRPPLWGELLRPMRDELGIDAEAGIAPLDLAGAYEDTFGRGRLEGLIRRLVTDEAWEPGRVHERLLGLPWTDVLTTNYDTLLERAARRVTDIPYEPVLTPEDLARTRSPRIVKLHGSMPSHTPFIVTASDYAGYPTRFAPFVNLARQIMLENDVLMVGFSGDDPNFAAWADWVRAEMDRHARTLFLASPSDLTDEQREGLRARRIVPIELGRFLPDGVLDRDRRNALALDLLVDALCEAEPVSPRDWPGEFRWPAAMSPPDDRTNLAEGWRDVDDPTFAAAYVQRCAGRWRLERATYPGWLEPPPTVARTMQEGLADHLRSLEAGLGAIPPTERARTLADVVWRVDLVHGTLDGRALAWLGRAAVDPEADPPDREDRIVLGRVLLRGHREREDRGGFDLWRDWLAAGADGDRETTALIAHEEALWCRDRLAYDGLRATIPTIVGDDPIWHLRRASLWGELGEPGEAVAAVRQAWLAVAADVARARRSVWLRSRLAWAAWVANAVTIWADPAERVEEFVAAGLARRDPPRHSDPTCDPWDVVSGLDDAVREAGGVLEEDRMTVTSGFDAGVTRGPGVTLRVADWATVERLVVRTADHVGIPPRVGNVNITVERIAQAVLASSDDDRLDAMRTLLAASRRPKALCDARFDRVGVARMDGAIVRELVGRVEHGLVTLAGRMRHPDADGRSVATAADRMATLLELLSRFVVRLPADGIAEVVRRALALSRDEASNAHAVFAPLGNLFRRALEALPATARANFLIDAVDYPLPSEKGIVAFPARWPDPLCEVDLVAPDMEAVPSRAVARLLDAAAGDHDADAPAAARRLSRLSELSLLAPAELAAFRDLVRRRRDTERGLAPWRMAGVVALCEVSTRDTPEGIAFVRTQVVDHLMDAAGPSPVALRLLHRLGDPAGGGVAGVLSTEEILRAVDQLLAWRGPVRDGRLPDLFGLSDRLNRGRLDGAASVLTYTLLPALDPMDVDEERRRTWGAAVLEPSGPGHLSILPHLVRLGAVPLGDAVEAIRAAALDGDVERSTRAFLAIDAWLDLGGAGIAPPALVEEVVAFIALRIERVLPTTLRIAARMVDGGGVDRGHGRRLVLGLAFLAREATYEAGPANEAGRSRLGLIRAGAVTLAGALVPRGWDDGTAAHWLEVGREDPLPEVRHAATRVDAARAGEAR